VDPHRDGLIRIAGFQPAQRPPSGLEAGLDAPTGWSTPGSRSDLFNQTKDISAALDSIEEMRARLSSGEKAQVLR
jgi:hypothetical protein